MNKIIFGKKYDTETADLILAKDNGTNANDFNYLYKGLYRKANGEWFIHVIGGAGTKYARYTADGWSHGGEAIFPVNEDWVKFWVAKHYSADVYENIFGEVSE